MKTILLVLAILFSAQVGAQNNHQKEKGSILYTSRIHANQINNDSITIHKNDFDITKLTRGSQTAGYYLVQASKWKNASYAAGLLGLSVCAIGGFSDDSSKRDRALVVAGVIGVISLICDINATIKIKKAGAELMFTGNGIRINL